MLSKIDGASEDELFLVASASSDGIIRVWDVRMANKNKSIPLAEVNTKSRLTCLAGSSVKCEFFTLLPSFGFSCMLIIISCTKELFLFDIMVSTLTCDELGGTKGQIVKGWLS